MKPKKHKVVKKQDELARVYHELAECRKKTKSIWKENPVLKQYEKLNLI